MPAFRYCGEDKEITSNGSLAMSQFIFKRFEYQFISGNKKRGFHYRSPNRYTTCFST